MARERSPNRDKAFELYKESNGEIQNREIANILGISEKTVSGWKTKDKWISKLNGVLQINERSTPKEKKNKRMKKEPIATEVIGVIENDDLTEKQRIFCLLYIKTFNATQSYRKAYNCSYDVANAEGYKLLVNPCIRDEIMQLKQLRFQMDFMDANDVIRKYQEIAFTDEEILDGAEVRTKDKLKALDFLTKYYKLLESESETKEDKLDQYLEQLQGVFEDD
ncbi:terminase small subunit [Turicibacter sanguinis]|uniref:terminase small subunit n=2 Tax=Turicibacter sanguinis TaxID=154288 RepID=UPI0021D4EB42|nr:terminase small subunit [Turicibacter sanguinis]MCU7192559.1 terminase small subunit [Turicibacter sanguinis]